MESTNHTQPKASPLRQKAEEQLKLQNSKTKKNVPEADMLKLIHELEVHQIELELINEELMLSSQRANEATEKYAELYDFAPTGYFTLSREGKILEMNLRSAQMLGKERSIALNSHFESFIKNESHSVFKDFLEEIFKGKNNAICDVPLCGKDTKSLHVHLTGTISEKKEQCYVTATDITERKKAEDDLRQNLAKYKVLIDTFPIGITISDPVGNIIETNEKAVELLGLSHEEQSKRKIKGDDWKIIRTDGTVFPQDEYASVKALKENRLVENVEMGIVKPSEEITWINVTAAPIPVEDFGVLIAYSDITRRMQMENSLHQNEERLRLALKATNDVVWDWDIVNDSQRWNEAGKKVFGWTEIVENTVSAAWWIERIHPDDQLRVHNSFFDVLNNPEIEVWIDEYRFQKIDGTYAYVMDRGYLLRDEQGNATRMIGAMLDITKQKDSELSLKDHAQKLNALIEAMPDMIFIMHRDGTILEIYGADAEKLIAPSDQLIGKSIFECFDSEETKRHLGVYNDCIKRGRTGMIEFELTIGETRFNFESRIKPLDDDRLLTIVRDVTQTKILQNAHKQELDFRRFLFETNKDGMVIFDDDHKVIDVNTEFCHMLGYTSDEMKHLYTWDFDALLDENMVREEFDPQGEIFSTFESVHRRKDGSTYDVEVSARSIRWKGERLVVCSCRDISDRIATAKQLEASEKKYRHLVESINDVLFTLDNEGIITYMSPIIKNHSGIDADEYIGRHFTWLIHPDHVEKVKYEFGQLQPGQVSPLEYRILTKSGDDVWARSHTVAGVNDEGRIEYRGIAQNITESRKAAIQLKESEEKYRMLFNANNDSISIFFIDKNGSPSDFIEMNEAGAKIIGYTKEELLNTNVAQLEEEITDDIRLKRIEDIQRNGYAAFETIVRHKSGQEIILETKTILINYKGKPAILNIARDITERKRAEEAMRERTELLQNITNHMFDMVAITDLTGVFTYAGPSHRILGFEPEQLLGTSVFEYLHPEDINYIEIEFRDLITHLSPDTTRIVEYRQRCSDGSYLWLETMGKILFNDNGTPYSLFFSSRNITERKRSEEALRKSEIDLRHQTRLQKLLMDISNTYINVVENDLDQTISKSLAELGEFMGADRCYIFEHDYNRQVTKNTHEWCADGIEPQKDQLQDTPFELFSEWLEANQKDETVYIHDVMKLPEGDNTRSILEPQGIKSLIAVPITDSGKCTGFIGFDSVRVHHIYTKTEDSLLRVFAQMLVSVNKRISYEHQIRESHEKYQIVAENTISWEFWEAPDGEFIYHSPSCERITGFKAEDLMKNYKLFLNMIHPDDIGTFMNHRIEIAHEQRLRQLNFRIINAQGEIRHIEHQCLPVFGFDGTYLGIRGSNVDITERIQAEEMVRQSRALLNTSQQLAHVGGWEWDVERKTMTWTDETYHIHKINPETTIPGSHEHINMSINCYDPDDRQVIEAAFHRCATEGITYDLEFPLTQTDGCRIWIRTMGKAVMSGNRVVKVTGTIMDITERKQAEEALRQSNDIVENIQLGFYIYHLEDVNDDHTLRLIFANPASEVLTGLKAESITGKTLDENFPNLREMNVPQRYAEVVRSAQTRTFEDMHYTDNRIMQACYSVKAFPLPNNHVGIAFEDITEKVSILDEIARSNMRLKEAQAVGNIGSWDYEIKNDKLVWSDQTFRIYGEDPDIFKPTFNEVIDCYPETDRELVLNAYSKALEDKSDFCIDHRILTKSGEIKFVQQNAKVVQNDDGNPVRLIGSVLDITERKQAEEDILRGKQRLESFLEISRGITSTFDQDKIMQMIVDNAIRILGLGSGAIYLQNDEETIRLEATSPALPHDFPDVFLIASLKDHPHIAKTFETGSYQLLADSSSAELTPAEQEIIKLRGLRSNLYLPIRLRENTIGVLILSSVGETYNFISEEIHLLQGFANQAAHIIDNLSNFAELKKYAAELEQQIVQRKEAEELIKQNEERFRQVAETNQTVIWEISTEGIYKYVSPMSEKIWGYKPSELVDKISYFNLHPEEGRQEFIEQTMKFLTETGSFNNLVNPIQKRDGSIIWVTSNGLPIYDTYGNLTGYRGSDQDITERLLAEKELLKFKTISDQANYGTAITDLEGVVLYVNKTFAQMHGWEVDELIGKSLAIFHNETQLPAVAELLDELRSTGYFSTKEVDHETKDGRVFTTLMNASVINNEIKEPVFLATTAIDITENKAARLELLKLTQAVVQNPVSIIITDTNGIVEYVNPRLCEVSGFQPEEVIGKHTRLFNSGHHPREIYHNMWTTITNGEIWNGELKNTKKNGEQYWEKVSISPIKDSEGNIINFVAIKEDITQQKQLLDDLKIAKENAEESNRLKTAFMNNISHEVRTPLNGILGFGEFMLDASLSQSDKLDHFQVLCESSDRLQQTIDDIMDISLIKAGAIKPKINEMLITLVLNQLLEKTMVACSKKNILVTLDVAEENENLILHTDEELFKKTLTQLLNNAVKFTKLGRITFGFEIIKGYMQFYVKDTGKGIASDKLELIFEPFMQEEVSNTRGYEGSGLGLSIARGFIEALGGKIWVESEKNVGSVFYFTLPLNKGETITESEEPKIRRSKSAKPLILIAEDEHSNYLYFKAILQRNGFTTLHVFNGAEAVDICHQFPEITLIFMDIKMPVMNGIEATKKIREFRPDLPIIATTAYAQTGDKHRFIAEGCNDYLAKPMKPNDILSMVKKYS